MSTNNDNNDDNDQKPSALGQLLQAVSTEQAETDANLVVDAFDGLKARARGAKIGRMLNGKDNELMYAAPGHSGPVNVTARMKEAMQFFKESGWAPHQAAGIVANLVAESSMKENLPGDGGQAFGLAQWHADRRAVFAQQFGHSMYNSTFREQLQFVNYELLEGNERAAGIA